MLGMAGCGLAAAWIGAWEVFYLLDGKLGPWAIWGWGMITLGFALLAWQAFEFRAGNRVPLAFRAVFLLLTVPVWLLFLRSAPGFDPFDYFDSALSVALACMAVAFPVIALTPSPGTGEDTYSQYVSEEDEADERSEAG